MAWDCILIGAIQTLRHFLKGVISNPPSPLCPLREMKVRDALCPVARAKSYKRELLAANVPLPQAQFWSVTQHPI